MEKTYLSANQLLIDSFALAEKIYLSGFKPDFIIGVWRGGAPVGIAIQEHLDYLGVHTDHIAIRTSSYTGINEQEQHVRVHGLDYIISNVNADDKVLLVDDVFDSGRSVAAIFDRMRKKCRLNMPHDMRVATPWFKPSKNMTQMKPDFYLHETDQWLVFPHEIKGLTREEIAQHKPDIAASVLPYIKE